MVNCNLCANREVNVRTCVNYCKVLNCGCHLEESNFRPEFAKNNPRMLPDLGEDKCPGFVNASFR